MARPTIQNVTLTTANTEYSYQLPSGTKKFMIRLRNVGYPLKLAMVASDSGTTYINIPQGEKHIEEIKDRVTLYFQTTANNQVAEILSWV